MNPRLPWAPFIALIVVTAAPAATFEGKVEMKMTANGHPPQAMTYQIREGQMRMDLPAGGKQGGASVIIDTAKQQMMFIMPSQRMYMIRPIPSASASAESGGSSVQGRNAAAGEIPPISATTESDKILGYNCVKYVTHGKADGSVTEIWVTDQLGSFAGLGGMGSGAPGGRMGTGAPPVPQGWEKALMGKAFFPLRVVGKDASGKENFRLEVVSVEKNTLPDSLFAPPDGYRELNLGNIMGGIMPH
jgi:hypothetical protein